MMNDAKPDKPKGGISMRMGSALCSLSLSVVLASCLQACGLDALAADRKAESVTSSGPASSLSDPSRFALLIGVDDYAQPEDPNLRLTPLKGPRNDVGAIKSLLTENYRFADDKEHVLTLIGPQATHAAIRDAFKTHLTDNAKRYKESANAEATVVFYFSGHGSYTDDQNKDEGDGVDETLVAYDSRAKGGTDIVDDEVDDWFEELRRYTKNITFILDSCHSGSATKAVLPASLLPKELPPDARPQPPQKPISRPEVGEAISRDVGNGILPRNQAYVAISGGLPEELSYEADVQTEKGTKRHGLLTYYLVNTLRTMPWATYWDATMIVRNAVLQHVSQHPQVEGDVERIVFGGAADRADPFITIIQVLQDGTFNINAGAAHGLQAGAFLAVYSPQAQKLMGDQDKLANARVIAVKDFTSVVQLSDKPRAPISTAAKVRIVTPGFGMRRLSVNVATLPDQQLTATDKTLLQRVAVLLRENELVELVNAPSGKNWNVAIQRGCVTDDGSLVISQGLKGAPVTCKPVYYLASVEADYPLLGFWSKPDDPSVAQELTRVIEQRAKQDNLRGLTNALSPLNGKVKVSLVKVETEEGPQGKPVIKSERQLPSNGVHLFKVGERLRIRIENQWEGPLYVALLDLGTSGSIGLLTARGAAIEILPNKSFQTEVLLIGPPLGLETYKVIASNEQVDYRVIERPGVKARASISPLAWLLSHSVDGKARGDTVPDRDVNVSSWAATEINLKVCDAHKPITDCRSARPR
jgi:hypothetical protein